MPIASLRDFIARHHRLFAQNVDGLHQVAGSMQVIDLHGRLDTVRCMDCEGLMSPEQLQAELLEPCALALASI